MIFMNQVNFQASGHGGASAHVNQDTLVSKVPLELIHNIFDYLNKPDIQACTYASKFWKDMVVDYVFDKEWRFVILKIIK